MSDASQPIPEREPGPAFTCTGCGELIPWKDLEYTLGIHSASEARELLTDKTWHDVWCGDCQHFLQKDD
jgi:hypothetical protein